MVNSDAILHHVISPPSMSPIREAFGPCKSANKAVCDPNSSSTFLHVGDRLPMHRIFAVRKVQTRHIHPCLNQRLQHFPLMRTQAPLSLLFSFVSFLSLLSFLILTRAPNQSKPSALWLPSASGSRDSWSIDYSHSPCATQELNLPQPAHTLPPNVKEVVQRGRPLKSSNGASWHLVLHHMDKHHWPASPVSLNRYTAWLELIFLVRDLKHVTECQTPAH